MATNPMQRKARNSFLLGMLLMLIITGAQYEKRGTRASGIICYCIYIK